MLLSFWRAATGGRGEGRSRCSDVRWGAVVLCWLWLSERATGLANLRPRQGVCSSNRIANQGDAGVAIWLCCVVNRPFVGGLIQLRNAYVAKKYD